MPRSLKEVDYMRLLPTETTATVNRLEILARQKMDGNITGRHSSPKKGFSVEFSEHRQYSPGDDIRNLDWKVYGKKDRYYIKQYIEETNLRCTILLDCSGSMNYRGDLSAKMDGQPVSKFEYGQYLAAALAYMVIRQQDAAGLVTFDTKIRSYVPARSRPSQVRLMLDQLHKTEAGEDTNVAEVLHEVAERIPRRGLVCIISDMFDDPERVNEALHHFAFRGHEVILYHLMAEEELTFPFSKFNTFKDLEVNGQRMQIDPKSIKAYYLDKVRNFVTSLERGCGQMGADYVPMTTKESFEKALTTYLARRRHNR
ncbi:MAG: hypothetical protein ACI9TH_000815 [Kiritimatiellia bacterium]|jgi:uncharacterized protein (DUF58 family)